MENQNKILLVEDDITLAEVYRSRLEIEGFEVKVVHDGEEALSTIQQYKPALVLLDVMMPKMNGFDVLQSIRNTQATASTRVIMLTALSQSKDKERAEALGANEYLVKSQMVIGDVIERVKYHVNS